MYGPPPYPVYVQPWQQPPLEPEPEPEPDPEPLSPLGRGGGLMLKVLVLAAVAGVVTVAIGLVFVLSAPEEYGLGGDDGREALHVGVQPTAPAKVGALSRLDPNAPAPVPTLPAAPAMMPSSPTRVIIPKIGVNAPVTSVGLDKDGAIQVPPVNKHNLIGWYRHGPTPGEAGPAVMLGHKDTTNRSAVFSRLHELRNGDTIEVARMDGTVAIFTVGGVEQAGKTTFPTNRVYGSSNGAVPELRLITCAGTYNRNIGHYTDNIIVYAVMTGTRYAK
jgi:sortase (surface protein transpeptidase)